MFSLVSVYPQGACVVKGACMAGGLHVWGHAWQGACVVGGVIFSLGHSVRLLMTI